MLISPLWIPKAFLMKPNSVYILLNNGYASSLLTDLRIFEDKLHTTLQFHSPPNTWFDTIK